MTAAVYSLPIANAQPMESGNSCTDAKWTVHDLGAPPAINMALFRKLHRAKWLILMHRRSMHQTNN